MRKKNSTDPAQLSFAFAPGLTPQLVTSWRRLKSYYPDPLVFVIASGHYVSLDQDAETIVRVTGCTFLPAQIPYVAIPVVQVDEWFEAFAHAGIAILICDPPDDPSRFVFT